jgi:hypothetical protein
MPWDFRRSSLILLPALATQPVTLGTRSGEFVAGEDGDGLGGNVRRPRPGHEVGDVLLGGEPFAELLQCPKLVAGVGAAAGQQARESAPPRLAAVLLIWGGWPGEQVCGESGYRPGVGGDRLGGLALGRQMQAERDDLRMEASGVHRPLCGLTTPGERRGPAPQGWRSRPTGIPQVRSARAGPPQEAHE